jgi:hypothetical protein
MIRAMLSHGETHLPPSGRGQGSDFPPLSTRARTLARWGRGCVSLLIHPARGSTRHDPQWAPHAAKRGADAEARCRGRPHPSKNYAKTGFLGGSGGLRPTQRYYVGGMPVGARSANIASLARRRRTVSVWVSFRVILRSESTSASSSPWVGGSVAASSEVLI